MRLVFTDTEACSVAAGFLAGRLEFAELADWADKTSWNAPTPARERIALAVDEVRDGVMSEDELRALLETEYGRSTGSSNRTFQWTGLGVVLARQSADVRGEHRLKLPQPA